MIEALQASLQPFARLNRRVAIGGSGLCLLLIGQSMMVFFGPFA
jgi:hypothetical protein